MSRVCRYARHVEAVVQTLAQRLAERTLELVDIPSESLHEAEVRAHLLSLVPEAFAPEYAAEDAFVFARPRRPDVPLVLLVGHYDTVPAQDNVPGRIAASASSLYAKNLFAFLEILVDKSSKALDVKWDDEIVKATALTRDGAVIHPNFAPKSAA